MRAILSSGCFVLDLTAVVLLGSGVACTDARPVLGPKICANGVLDPGETDVDCGGTCSPCATGRSCVSSADCASTVCQWGLCRPGTCGNETKDQDETDVDCGGSCGGCGGGGGCELNEDCHSNQCVPVGGCIGISCAKVCLSGFRVAWSTFSSVGQIAVAVPTKELRGASLGQSSPAGESSSARYEVSAGYWAGATP